MNKRLLFIGGILNGLFTVFHVLLGWQIHLTPGLSLQHRVLMQMLNVGGILMVAFATVVSLFYTRDLIGTGLGKATMILIALFYTSRAVEEVVLAPDFSPLIFGVCLIVAIVYGLAIAGTIRKPEVN
jgi:hypothetical protein